MDHPWHQNNQYWPLSVKWIIKNPIFYWYLTPFLLEAVEASQCYFFKNLLMKLKCPDLFLKPNRKLFCIIFRTISYLQHVQNRKINKQSPCHTYYGLNNKIKGPSHKYLPVQFALMKIVNRITGHFLRRFLMQSS